MWNSRSKVTVKLGEYWNLSNIQSQQCCGAEGPEDWSRSVYNGYKVVDFDSREIGVASERQASLGSSEGNLQKKLSYILS